MSLYENIKSLCDRNHIAVTRLEAELGFARGSIGKIRQQKSMKADRLDKIADYFGVSVEYLMTGEHPPVYHFDPETARIAQDIFDNPDLHFLFKSARTTSSKNIKILSELLETLEKTEAGDNNDPA